MNPSSDSYRNPLRYGGQDYSFAPRYLRPRDPLAPTNASSDIKPKEQQGYYPLGSLWTNSTNGNLWALATITNNKAHWILIGSTGDNPILSVTGDDSVKVVPDAVGNLTLQGLVVANGTHTKAVFTKSPSASTEAIDIQLSAAIAATDVTKVGLSAFNNTEFTVDANGFVSLVGGGASIQKVAVDANTAPGTNPVVPTSGQITVTGAQVAAGTTANVIRTDSLAPNTYTIEIQRSKTEAATTIGSNGVSHYSSAQFSVDATGFVTLLGTGLAALQKVIVQTPGNGVAGNYTYTPTTNMKYCIVELVAGGGGGGGVASTDASTAAAAAGGGGGGYARRLLTAAQIGVSQAVTIGAGGAGGAAGNNNGAAGGTTSLGALLSATGGGAGSGTAGATVTSSTAPGASGGVGSSGDLNLQGSNSGGGHVWFNAASFAFGLSGDGGNSFWGPGVTGGSGNNDGGNGTFGAGGAGASANPSNGTGQAGGNGGDGFMLITEFCS